MARAPKWIAEQYAAFGLPPLPPLRQYWREINRQERQAKAQARVVHKVRDQRRPHCQCRAYPWPHRPGGGLCRYPDPPLERYQKTPKSRPYRSRYAGLRRQIARVNRLHPIRDRAKIDAVMPHALALAKQLKRQYQRVKFRNMFITDTGIRGEWQTSGPAM